MNFDIIHIGLPKCASTFLQDIAFKQHPEIYSFTRADLLRAGTRIPFKGDVLTPSRLQRLKNDIEALPYPDEPSVKTRVFTDEGLAGLSEGAEKVHHLFPDAKILIILRNQYTLTYSRWNHYVKEGGTLSIRRYIHSPGYPTYNLNMHPWLAITPIKRSDSALARMTEEAYEERIFQGSQFSSLLYDKMVSDYQNLFGVERVKVMFFEDLKRDYDSFMKEVFSYLNVDTGYIPESKKVRFGLSYLPVNMMRFLNLPFRSYHNQFPFQPLSFAAQGRLRMIVTSLNSSIFARIPLFNKRIDAKQHFPDFARNAICESNRKLSELTGRDLKEIGYDT